MKLKSLASIHRVAKDDVDWINVEKNIYDEKVDIRYTFRLFGIPLFIWKKDSDIKHNLDKETSLRKTSGFKRD